MRLREISQASRRQAGAIILVGGVLAVGAGLYALAQKLGWV